MHEGRREMSRQGGGLGEEGWGKKVPQPREQPEMKWRAETPTSGIYEV